MPARDIIVIGASAGGLEALQRLIGGLPASLPAAVLVVLHRAPEQDSYLPLILRRAGHLPAADAWDGEGIQKGRIYVAPPDRHLLIEDGALRLVRGPKENHTRPAIDPLFRSASREFGPRVVGVILSGTLYDGTAGLFDVKRRGGVAVVQDPHEALFPGMPESAIGNVEVDHVLPAAEIARLLARLAEGSGEQNEVEPAMSSELDQLNEVITRNQDEQVRGERRGGASTFTCPDCSGTLWQANLGALVQFRCHVGHVYSAEGLAQEENEQLERSLWTAVRVFADKALLMRQLAGHAREQGDARAAESMEEKAALADLHSGRLRRIIEENGVAPTGEAPSAGNGRSGDEPAPARG
jgi:two-component system, chemotaxis family, protein-glutamate methylesterase/glutaminase